MGVGLLQSVLRTLSLAPRPRCKSVGLQLCSCIDGQIFVSMRRPRFANVCSTPWFGQQTAMAIEMRRISKVTMLCCSRQHEYTKSAQVELVQINLRRTVACTDHASPMVIVGGIARGKSSEEHSDLACIAPSKAHACCHLLRVLSALEICTP